LDAAVVVDFDADLPYDLLEDSMYSKGAAVLSMELKE
jgi:hypothetical protein